MRVNYKGYCLWADDIPDPLAPHYIVVTSDSNPEGLMLVCVISSIKYKPDGTPKYHDTACLIHPGEITDESGRSIITKPSFVRYQYACEMESNDILLKQLSGKYKYKCKISDALLKRIQDGAKISLELEPRFKKYFDYF